MSGHSKWSTIKHKKAVTDAKRANVFTKLAKDVTIAAREGGDPEMNYKLRLVIDKAKAFNMPKDNIERAIKRGTGELKDAAQIEEALHEAYGPGQIAMLIKVATDNKNRTLAEVRSILTKNGGKMTSEGSVSWQFEHVGIIEVDLGKKEREAAEMSIIESGAKDYRIDNDDITVFARPADLQKVKKALEQARLDVREAVLGFVAKDAMEQDEGTKEKYEKLLVELDQHDDVVEVFDNL